MYDGKDIPLHFSFDDPATLVTKAKNVTEIKEIYRAVRDLIRDVVVDLLIDLDRKKS